MKILERNIDENNNTNTIIKNTSFLLKIKYNQNHSIQGSIQWLEKKKTVYFRSLMELILLLQEASSDHTEQRTWDGDKGMIEALGEIDQSTGSDSGRG